MLQTNILPLITFIFWSRWTLINVVVSDPQADLLTDLCNPSAEFLVTNVTIFDENLNATLRGIREQISDQNKHFATAQQAANGGNTVSTLFQCRSYLSVADCVACFDVAATQILSCPAGDPGGRAIYDGCYLRYDISSAFFSDTAEPINSASCGNQTTTEEPSTAFTSAVQQILMNLQTATPRISGFSAATKTQLPNNASTIYAFAQCIETITQSKCENCLNSNYNSMQTCLTNSEGRAYANGCFLRYSTTPFFPHNQTIDITPSFEQQGSSNKGAIVGGVVGSVVVLALIFAVYVRSRRLKKRSRRVPRGQMKGSLNWKQRYGIILGTARGLAYLHEEFHVCVIHRDIKPNNILLDDDLQPKIADFGLARFLPGDKSHLSTKCAGTLGYTAPEYVIYGQLSEKADVYSYGVAMLEIISGQKSKELAINGDNEGEYLLQKAWKLYERGIHVELVDETLDPNDYDVEEVKKVIEVSLLCTQASAEIRPTMSEVVVLLQNKDLLENMKPTMPVLIETN
ncbi:cysteine-rich receptor-like protein kinase 42 [Neltuma alba]|uniref:cysteine-rich receptor-like protein kinase 42 n=1 Tax=Neltuma alba TaxID=207710 RepID=UPI0010A4E85F|nr:cysteine-rich receptor-like protein kinase 42 [Prosopis alba]